MIGLSPSEVKQCSLWEFRAAAEGYRRAHMSEEEKANELTIEEFKELSALIGPESN